MVLSLQQFGHLMRMTVRRVYEYRTEGVLKWVVWTL